jgi:D-aminopeptidase
LSRPRSRDLGLRLGELPSGPRDAITDVARVRVGHCTLIEGEAVRTGVTAVLPHGGNPFVEKVRAGVHVYNGFGKTVGLEQVRELGQIESPILLTSTLNVWRVADALVDWLAERNPGARSMNPLVAECNDGFLNDNVARPVRAEHVRAAIGSAGEEVAEGNAGAGVGMTGFGWKGGIGTASRVAGEATVGALALLNCGDPGELRIGEVHVGRIARPASDKGPDGSIIVLLATDAGLDARQLGRLAKRGVLGLGRVGASGANGSGDVFLAFTTHRATPDVPDDALSPVFQAAVEATEAAIVNALLAAETLRGRDGHVRYALPADLLR